MFDWHQLIFDCFLLYILDLFSKTSGINRHSNNLVAFFFSSNKRHKKRYPDLRKMREQPFGFFYFFHSSTRNTINIYKLII